nr:WYL domain-containing protein [Spirochaetia bacterium]
PPPAKMNVEVWRKLIKAIIMNSVINISYKAPGHEKPVERRLCPYYLLINKGMWYILTNNEIRDRIETYAVHRISKIEILSEHFSISPDFRIEDRIDKDWGIFSHEEKYDIEIEFNQYIATHIKEKVWPGSYEITETPEGYITLKFTTNQLESVLFWLLPWGTGAKVINPPELKEMVLEVIEGMMELYSNP